MQSIIYINTVQKYIVGMDFQIIYFLLNLLKISFTMQNHTIFNLQKLIAFRHHMHQNPEISFQEYKTRQNIKKFLVQIGIPETNMTEMAKTALVVDLKGQAPAQGTRRCIALRADMDALSMKQMSSLQYKSKNQNAAHMCGHDGHVTCLLSFVMLYQEIVSTIPENKIVRLLFQPSQQGPLSGAQLMIKQGCLDGVDQVYGFHNWPTKLAGELWVKEGPVMSEITILKISIIGTGGHGSEPQKVKDCIKGGIYFMNQIQNFKKSLFDQGHKFVCTFPVFLAGQRYNVFSQVCKIQGSIRSFTQGLNFRILEKIRQILGDLQLKQFKHEFQFTVNAPININTKSEAEHVERVAKKFFGADKVGPGELPFRASEDFAYFTKKVPGAFYFLSSGKTLNHPSLHRNNFDFNDNLIQPAGKFWLALTLDRLELAN